MPSIRRRAVLTSLGTVALGSIAGCGSLTDDRPPAGSLQFVNEHTLPHSISMEVLDVGTGPADQGTVRGDPRVPPGQRDITASTVVDPGETGTYEQIFTADIWYAVRMTVDGRDPENETGIVSFTPAPSAGNQPSFLGGNIYPSGEFSWVVSATDDPGPFES